MFSAETLCFLMIGSLFLFLMAGFPVALTLGGVALIFGLIGLDFSFFELLPLRIWGVMNNYTLLAVPLFVFMGVMLERSGIAERLLIGLSTLFGKSRSGLAISVIMAGTLLAASTGIVGATVVTMGLISLPIMLKNGYSAKFSSGLICASGTLGQIIPPSIVLILLGDIVGVSVGELFLAAVIPGLMLVLAYVLFSVFACRKHVATQISTETANTESFYETLLCGLLPAGLLVISVLGAIFLGVASPTEAASIGALGALILAIVYRKFSLKVLVEVMDSTTKLTSMVFLILIGASAFGLVFRGLDGDMIVTDWVLGLGFDRIHFILVVMLLMFVLGCFLDFIEIIFVVVPIIFPLLKQFEIDPLWFSILVAMNLQMSFLTPPFGFSLFYLKGVADKSAKTEDIYLGAMPFVAIQAIVLLILVVFPEIVQILPNMARQ
jgi:tripartite ATP-independent transporter DctM subunit